MIRHPGCFAVWLLAMTAIVASIAYGFSPTHYDKSGITLLILVAWFQGSTMQAFAPRVWSLRSWARFSASFCLGLGLIGTIIGFILMTPTVAGLDPSDQDSTREALNAMSNGMSLALWTTATGLITHWTLRIQVWFSDLGDADCA